MRKSWLWGGQHCNKEKREQDKGMYFLEARIGVEMQTQRNKELQ